MVSICHIVTGMKKTISKLHFEVHLVEHCNLHCKGCAHFSPLAKKEFLDLEKYEKDLKRLNELTNGEVQYIKLLGGEPLLHPKIEQAFDITRKYFAGCDVILITNGVKMCEMSSDFFENCKKNRIHIEITKYPIEFNYDVVIDRLEKEGVEYSYRGNTDTQEKKFWHLRLDLEGKQKPDESFNSCRWGNGAICLADGKLYSCVIPAYIRHFNNYFKKNLIVCENDYVDIYKANDEREICERLSKPMPFCKYCRVDDGNIVYNEEYGHSKYVIEEWT